MAAFFPAAYREQAEAESSAAAKQATERKEEEKGEEDSGQQQPTEGDRKPADEPLSGSAHSWYYEDESGATQGPFPASHMAAWHAAGYFTPHTLVRRDDEPSMTQLQQRATTDFIPDSSTQPAASAASTSASAFASSSISSSLSSSSSLSTAEPPPPPPPQYYRPAAGEQDWYYTDSSGRERGPFSTSQMHYWHTKGFFTYNRCPVRLATQPHSAALPLHLHASPPAFTVSAAAAAAASPAASALSSAVLPAPAALLPLPLPPPPSPAANAGLLPPRPPPSAPQLQDAWHYIDAQAQMQGPFSTAQMAAWWAAGYIPASVQVLQVGETAWRTVEQRGADCAFVHAAQTAAASATAAAAVSGAAALYGQTVMLGARKAVSAGSGVVTTRKDIGDHYYDHDSWQHALNQKR